MGEARPHSTDRTDRAVFFGPFCLLPDRHLLFEGETPVSIGSRALDILLALTDRAGELVTRDELVARAWPNITVNESNLRAQVAVLRKALRERRAGISYIVAVPGRGYRFVAPVTRTAPAPGRRQGRHNLPARLERPIGRDTAIGTIKGRLNRSRIVTIVGHGGIGKTTLSLAVAEDIADSYKDGVCFLDLAPLTDARLVAGVLASALGLANVAEDPLPDLAAFLQKRHMLLLFDSCETVIDTAAMLAEALVKAAPGIHVLATSREALRAEGESVFRLPPLDSPPVLAGLTAADALTFPAVQLFVDRAASSGSEFALNDTEAPLVADICRQLDGNALAIELAAGRVDAFGIRGIAERLDDRFRLLRGGRRTALPRHQTLAATLDWSYDALSPAERKFLCHVSVFAGEFTLDEARAVATESETFEADCADHLASLIAKSLISAETRGPVARYRLLDTTRAYAAGKLARSDDFNLVLRRLTTHLCGVFDGALGELEALPGPEWLARYGRYVNTVQRALDWAFSPGGDPASGMALTVAAIPLWFRLSLVDECRDRVHCALANTTSEESRVAHARHVMRLYCALGLSRVFTAGLAPQATAAWAKALEIAEELGDADDRLEALWGVWFCQVGAGEYRAALDTGRRFAGLAQSITDCAIGDRLISTALFCLGDIGDARRHLDRMQARPFVSAAEAATPIGFRFDEPVAARALLGQVLWLQGFPDQATRVVEAGIQEVLTSGHAISLCDLLARGACPVALLAGDLAAAQRATAMLLDHAEQHSLGSWGIFGRCWRGALLIREGDADSGIPLLEAALAALQEGRLFSLYSSAFLAILAEGLAQADRVQEAYLAVERGLERCMEKQELWYVAELLRVKGEIVLRDGSVSAAKQHFQQSIEQARRQEALSWELRAATSLARLQRDRNQSGQAQRLLADVCARFSEGFATTDFKIASALLARPS
jgi:predicted ATPase/DNA-binding winged helix-turn-helix (wHTH) protein